MVARLGLNTTYGSKRAIFVYMSKHCWTLKGKKDVTIATSFYPLHLSDTKRQEILHRAVELRNIRNEISEVFYNNMLAFQDMSKFDAFNYFNPLYNRRVAGFYIKKVIEDVWRAYRLRYDRIKSRIEFNVVESLEFLLYKKPVPGHSVGDLREIVCRRRKTELTTVLTWLARYGTPNTEKWLKSNVSVAVDSKRKFYTLVLSKINKYGYARLIRLALLRRDRVYRHFTSKGRITFESLSFSGCSRIKRPIVSRSNKIGGKFKYYAEISWDWSSDCYHGEHANTLCIPIKYNKRYHRNLSRYSTEFCTFYTVVIRGKDIHLVVTRKGSYYTSQEDITDSNTIGIDVNSKHNLLSLSDGTFVLNDRDIVKDLEMLLMGIDSKQSHYVSRVGNDINVRPFCVSRRDKLKVKALSNKLREFYKRTISGLCRKFVIEGIRHIALENLCGFQNSRIGSRDIRGFNLGRLTRVMGLSSLKDEFSHIAPKYGLSVSLVQPEYTSILCGYCGCLNRGNRQTQEKFKCLECGHSENADIHSAKNIKFRLTATVLRGYLLEKARNNEYRNFQPKSLPRWQVREFLEKCRSRGVFKAPQRTTEATCGFQ